MKLRSTTPLSVFFGLARVVALVSVVAVVIVGAVIQSPSPSSALSGSEQQARIDELTKEIDASIVSTRKLNRQSNSLSSQVAASKRERLYLYSHLKTTASSLTKIKQKIRLSKKRLDVQREVLGRVLVSNYIDGTISPIEMLASSDSVATFFDRQAIREGLRIELNKSVTALEKAQRQLAKDKDELVKLLGDQANQRIALNQRAAEQSSLLAATNGRSAKLEKITAKMAAERKKLQTNQQQSITYAMVGAELVTNGTISEPIQEPAPKPQPQAKPKPITPEPTEPSEEKSSKSEETPKRTPSTPKPTPAPAPKPTPKPTPVVLPNGGYPSYLQNCYVDANALSYGIDPWGYGCRQCVSYTAWKVLQKTGKTALYWGNAKDWPKSAKRVGYKTGTMPKAKSVGVMTSGPYGHVVWVEKVNSNGTINISQYNYWLAGKSNGGWGWYSEFKNVSPKAYQAYIYV